MLDKTYFILMKNSTIFNATSIEIINDIDLLLHVKELRNESGKPIFTEGYLKLEMVAGWECDSKENIGTLPDFDSKKF